MILLRNLEKVNDVKHKVNGIHYMPFDPKHGFNKTADELNDIGVLVDDLEEPQNIPNKVAILYCNPNTKETWYEYEDVEPTNEEILSRKVEMLEQLVADLASLQLGV